MSKHIKTFKSARLENLDKEILIYQENNGCFPISSTIFVTDKGSVISQIVFDDDYDPEDDMPG
jgi:hypothetical protein